VQKAGEFNPCELLSLPKAPLGTVIFNITFLTQQSGSKQLVHLVQFLLSTRFTAPLAAGDFCHFGNYFFPHPPDNMTVIA